MAGNKVNSGLLEFSEDQKVFVALDAETSEVKKAVTIDGDGVETDIVGVQPTGKKEITSTAEVDVANYATAQVVDEDLVAGNIKKDVDILGVVGSYEPVVPASDFSIARITVVDEVHAEIKVPLAVTVDNEKFSSTGIFESGTYDVILYNGNCYGAIPDNQGGVVSVSGDIVKDEYDDLIITGNGTISITPPSLD